MRASIGLITAVLSLIAAAFTFYRTIGQEEQLERQKSQLVVHSQTLEDQREALRRQQEELKRLRSIAGRLALEITIDQPHEGELIPPSYGNMRGSLRGDFPVGHTLWVLGKNNYRYFLQSPSIHIQPAQGWWQHENIRLSTPGEWALILCITNAQATAWLESRADQKNWEGFAILPEGSEIVQSVKVNVGSQ